MVDDDGRSLVDPLSYAQNGYPHALWTRLRNESPVQKFEPAGWPAFWAVTKHADIRDVSKQPDVFLNEPGMTIVDLESLRRQEAGNAPQMKTIINMDPPEHRKFRAVASPFFTPRALERLDAVVDATARKVVDALGDEGECDFVTEVASIYPLKIIARILGVPEEDEPFILRLTNELFGSADPEFQRSENHEEHIRTLFMDFYKYFTRVIESRRASPTDDLASMIANARVDGAPMGEIETLGYYLITFTAGHETTRGAIGGGLEALVRNPTARARWAREPKLTRLAIDEIMRWVTPVNTMMRTAASDCTLNGQRIRKGDRLVLFYASANRDEDVFEAPLELRLDRHPNPHLAFGIGEHFCLGAHLARKTSGRLFQELVSRLDSVELTAPPQHVASNLVPGFKHMPIRYRMRKSAAAA
ncbi:MAG: cytochrome P450 [Myxococcota bacterium]